MNAADVDVRTLIFIDDNIRGLEYFCEELERNGFEVRRIADVDTALSISAEEWRGCDAVILDIMMPRGAAYENSEMALRDRAGVLLFQDIRKIAPGIPVL